MDSPDPSGAVSRLVSILRKVTRVVQIAPFVYLFFYAVYLFTEPFLGEGALGVLDVVMYTNPVSVLLFLLVGRLLRLCAWFKTACLLPMLSHVESFVDTCLFQFTQVEVVALNITTAVISVAFIAISIRHFFAR